MIRDANYEKLKLAIKELSANYTVTLKEKVCERIEEMKKDDKSHYLLYKVLGITDKEGDLIDIYQNKGRFRQGMGVYFTKYRSEFKRDTIRYSK